jgi:hypothetical protein
MAHTVSDAAVTVLAYRLGVTGTFCERPWFWEGHVQTALAAHFISEGWDVREAADTESKAPGIDLLATKDHRWLAIEVKGFPNTTYDHGPNRGQPKPTQPTNQARQWFSHALLGMMLLRDKRPDAEIAICFPRFKTYENLVQRTTVSFGLLSFGVYFVNENGSVDLVLPHRPVGDAVDGPVAMTAQPEAGEAVRGAAAGREATCRAEVLAAFDRLERRHGRAVFAPVEIVQEVLAVTDRYPEHTIRTEIVSRMCAEAPVHHAVAYNDLERVDRGRYRLRTRSGPP